MAKSYTVNTKIKENKEENFFITPTSFNTFDIDFTLTENVFTYLILLFMEKRDPVKLYQGTDRLTNGVYFLTLTGDGTP